MRPLLFVLVALVFTGCGTSRQAIETTPATLREVNDVLAQRRALVTFTDGREVETYVFVGPVETVLRDAGRVETRTGDRVDERRVPTESIVRIEADASLTTWEGAKRGAGIGAVPGGVVAVAGLGLLAVGGCSEYCFGEVIAIIGGGFLAASGALVGAGTGAVVTSGERFQPVYLAPVARYPDAALLERATEDAASPVAPR